MDIKISKEQMLEMAQKLAKMDFCPEQKVFYKNVLEMVKADAEGRLVVLPCKVGDMVYCIYSRYTKCSTHNEEFEESSCQGCESECDSKREYYINEQKAYGLDWIVTQIVNKYFGRTVFLTREEAEAALEKMGGGDK